jgi:hypothetical protein
MHPWLKALAGIALVVFIAGAGILANFGLLRLTSDVQDPVGKLSPRSLVSQTGTGTPTTPATQPATDADDDSPSHIDTDD